MIYTVGEMAKILNVTTSALRYYDKEGLHNDIEAENIPQEWYKFL